MPSFLGALFTGLGKGLSDISDVYRDLLMRDIERKKEYDIWAKKQKEILDRQSALQEAILNRQLKYEEFKREDEELEDVYGKNYYVKQLAHRARKGDPEASLQLANFVALRHQIRQWKPLTEKDNELLKTLDPGVQLEILEEIARAEREQRDYRAKEEAEKLARRKQQLEIKKMEEELKGLDEAYYPATKADRERIKRDRDYIEDLQEKLIDLEKEKFKLNQDIESGKLTEGQLANAKARRETVEKWIEHYANELRRKTSEITERYTGEPIAESISPTVDIPQPGLLEKPKVLPIGQVYADIGKGLAGQTEKVPSKRTGKAVTRLPSSPAVTPPGQMEATIEDIYLQLPDEDKREIELFLQKHPGESREKVILKFLEFKYKIKR